MKTCIREIRHAMGLTLQDVADRCIPPTTAQTIGRLETGTRTVSIDWLNRIGAALGVEAAELVRAADQIAPDIIAVFGTDGAVAPRQARVAALPRPPHDGLAMLVEVSAGEYRHGDMLWLERIEPDAFGTALNRDVLAPMRGGRFAFGRLVGRDRSQLQILAPGQGSRQQVIPNALWLAVATRLIRSLG